MSKERFLFPGLSQPITFLVSGDTEEYEQNITKFDNTLYNTPLLWVLA